jgi:flagellar motor protein MotB
MRSKIIGLIGLIGLVAGAAGCQNKMRDENTALWNQNRELQSQLNDTRSRLNQAPDPTQLVSMQTAIQQRDAQIAELKAQLQRPTPGAGPEPGLAGIEVTKNDVAGTLTVNLPGDVLFPSGSSDLKPSAKVTLNKVISAVNKEYAGKRVFVDGYTDSDPITRTKDKYDDNLDLSAERARSVYAYLISQGMSPRVVAPRAFGATNPKATKAASRRVEIVVATR